MTDKTIRHLATAAVLLVAAIAAVVSYQHLYHLAVTHGETRMDSALIPLSIDGTVVTASLLMLRAARLGLRTPWLARCMLALAVTMTVAANVAFGWQYAAWGVFIAGWPAAAFLLNAESSISFGRKTSLPAAVPVVAEPVTMEVSDSRPSAPVPSESGHGRPGLTVRQTAPNGSQTAPKLTVKAEAAMRGKSERTIYRERKTARRLAKGDMVTANGNRKAHS